MREETEDQLADAVMWLRRTDWKRRYPWQAEVVAVSGHPLTRAQAYGRTGRPDRRATQDDALSGGGDTVE